MMQLTDIQLGALKYAIGALPNSPTGRIASDTICQIVTAHNAKPTMEAQPSQAALSDKTLFAVVLKELIKLFMIWNGQASAGLDVTVLAGLRDELDELIERIDQEGGGA